MDADPTSAAISGGSNIIGSALSFIGQQQANSANMAEAQRNRQFQLDMSSTAYQRATKDMQAAGINPMLAYMQGGASSGTGAQGVAQNEFGSAQQSGKALADATVASRQLALQDRQQNNQDDITEATVDKLQSEAEQNRKATQNLGLDAVVKDLQAKALDISTAKQGATKSLYDMGSGAAQRAAEFYSGHTKDALQWLVDKAGEKWGDLTAPSPKIKKAYDKGK